MAVLGPPNVTVHPAFAGLLLMQSRPEKILVLVVQQASRTDTIDMSQYGMNTPAFAFFLSGRSAAKASGTIAGSIVTTPAGLPVAPDSEYGIMVAMGT